MAQGIEGDSSYTVTAVRYPYEGKCTCAYFHREMCCLGFGGGCASGSGKVCVFAAFRVNVARQRVHAPLLAPGASRPVPRSGSPAVRRAPSTGIAAPRYLRAWPSAVVSPRWLRRRRSRSWLGTRRMPRVICAIAFGLHRGWIPRGGPARGTSVPTGVRRTALTELSWMLGPPQRAVTGQAPE